MDMNDFDDFSGMMTLVAEQYGRQLSPELLRFYYEGLAHFDLPTLRSAFSAHVRNTDNGQFMPKVADIIRAINGNSKDTAVLAWMKVANTIRRYGNYASIIFDDPLIHRVVEDLGGWIQVCGVSDKEEPHLQRRFEDAYRAYKARGDIPPFPPRLVGTVEASNNFRGYVLGKDYDDPVRFVGDRAACERLAQGHALLT